MIWIGFVLVVLASGQSVTDAAFFADEKECKEASAAIVKQINDSPQVIAYKVSCERLDKLPKPGANV